MLEYHKIQSIYKRDPETKFKTFLDGDWAVPAFGLLKDLEWTFTEKVDGTNIRVGWDGETVRIGGRTSNAQIPAPLVEHLNATFTPDAVTKGLTGPATLVGEGYGGKIQKGSGYRPTQAFILFDVFIEPNADHPLGIWLEREAVESIAASLGIPLVPILHTGPLLDGMDICQAGMTSQCAEDAGLVIEGVVARPSVELRDRLGNRIITKIKCRDFRAAQ